MINLDSKFVGPLKMYACVWSSMLACYISVCGRQLKRYVALRNFLRQICKFRNREWNVIRQEGAKQYDNPNRIKYLLKKEKEFHTICSLKSNRKLEKMPRQQ